MQGNTAEMQRLLEAMEARKTAMSAEIKETFDRLEEKGGEMEVLIDQSGEILKKTTDQVDGALKIVNGTLQEHAVNFQQILGKVTQYDELLSRQRQPQGKGQSSTGKGWQEPQYGLINDKDIKMPMFPDKFDSVEVFRRWWKETAEYCNNNHRFNDIKYLFKAVRGYQTRIGGPQYIELIAAVNHALPGDRGDVVDGGPCTAILDKEFTRCIEARHAGQVRGYREPAVGG